MDRIATISRHLTSASSTVFTKQSLQKYNGRDDKKIYIALKGDVFDVTEGSTFYGPGSSYNAIAGKDASVALGKMDLEAKTIENGKIEDLNAPEMKTLDSWHAKFLTKYKLIGKLQA